MVRHLSLLVLLLGCGDDLHAPDDAGTCKPGYTGDGVTCNDVDECTANLDCDANATCTNTVGSFTCACNSGFTGNGVTCADIDECAANTDSCDASATCTNTPGAFACACNAGFTGDGATCLDIDECATSTDNCDGNASCSNTPGSFACACNAGFAGDGATCLDIDECAASTDNCDGNATCTNTVGSFTCACNSGFTGDGVACVDVDECTSSANNCAANATCVNTTGAFMCACNAGFIGDGVTCADIDECAINTDNCDNNASCANTVGSFTCACNGGFTGDGLTCADVDECAINTDNCDNNASCANTPGSFACACNAGFTGNGLTCVDVDECAANIDNCDVNASCANTPGSFACACNTGYTGDGIVCGAALARPISPLSTATATSRRPTLRWVAAPGSNGTRVEVCSNRACTAIVASLDTTAASIVPASDLPSGVLFWRLRAWWGTTIATETSATWQLVVGTRSGVTDTSWGSVLDVNGDGFADVAIGAPYWNNRTGRVHVFIGSAAGLSSTPTASFTGPAARVNFGVSVASAGDVDGDGFADLIVGAPNYGYPPTSIGRAYLYRGSATGIATAPVQIVAPGASDEAFAGRVAVAGDVNHDGYADVAIAASYANAATGSVYIYYGSASGLAATPAVTLTGPAGAGHYFGSQIASGGDIDGDGDEELFVNDQQTMYIYLGAASGLSTTPINYAPMTVATQPGDYNGDGYADVIRQRLVGTAVNLELYIGGPSGISATPLSSFNRNFTNNCTYPSGYTAFSYAGDVDGDGYGDVVMGMPSAGLQWYAGLPGGYAVVLRGSSTGFAPSARTGLCYGDIYSVWGNSVAGAGDVDGDGYADVVVGGPGRDDWLGGVGVFPGSAAGTIDTYAPWLVDPDGMADAFGMCVF